MDKTTMITTPAQREEVLQAEFIDSLIVYDLTTSTGHRLEPMAAFVWKSCDGRTVVSDIARLVERKYGIEGGEEVVLFILEQFRRKRLLKEVPVQPRSNSLVSRRDIVRKYIPAAMVLPFILSATAPTRAQLTSGGPLPRTTASDLAPLSPLPGVGVAGEGGNLPYFIFSGGSVSMLLVSRKRKRRNNASPTELNPKDSLDTQWLIEGRHDASAPITYGVVPSGMSGVVSAKPLVEGEFYFIQSKVHASDKSFLAEQYFRIQDGKVVEVPEN